MIPSILRAWGDYQPPVPPQPPLDNRYNIYVGQIRTPHTAHGQNKQDAVRDAYERVKDIEFAFVGDGWRKPRKVDVAVLDVRDFRNTEVGE